MEREQVASPRLLDTLQAQLDELAQVRHPQHALGVAELRRFTNEQLGYSDARRYGIWCYYPWRNEVVHILPETEFRELRSARNRNHITAAEQVRLRRKIVGIIGVSVGQAVAMTMTLEGVGGEFRLADPDQISLSNLNRIRSPLRDIGRNKAVVAARQMLEIDPYLKISVYSDGLDEGNLAPFMSNPRPLDILVEECDDLYIKLLGREHARRLRVPVLMHTSDRGLLDIERFDLDPTREPFHGRLSHVSSEDLRGLSAEQKIPFVTQLLDLGMMSNRAKASLREVGKTLTTWPQLGSAVARGGATVTAVARRILLDHDQASGRFYDDIDDTVPYAERKPH